MSASRKTICRTFVCVPYWHQTTYGINAICCRIKHNRAKPMFESASAIFSIADAGEFRFARFYIVCEEVPLGTPESPPIASGVSDMHPSDCPNVEETRNPMQTFSRKKCSHFSPTNFHLHFHMKSPSVLPVILLITPKRPTRIAAISFNNRYQASDRNTPKSDKPPQNCAPDSCRQSGLC